MFNASGKLLTFTTRPGLRYFSTVVKMKGMPSFKTIGTHNGTFHCDEVLGCYMLKLLSPEARIVRSRNPDELSVCDIVIDVGGEYNPQKYRFDHHQRDFKHSMSTVVPGKKWTMKLSSAGLIYCHFGKEIIRTVLGEVDDRVIEPVYDKMYDSFIQEIDGIDNGVPMYEGEPAYRITTNLSSRVSYLNQNWTQKEFDEVQAFGKAMELVGSEFENKLKYYHQVWWPARSIVADAIEKRFQTHSSGEIIQLETFCPWEEHLFQLEKEVEVNPPLKFIIFQDRNDSWRVRGISIASGSFLLRTPLFDNWRGLNNEELSTASGIKDCIFVHSSGFIGGNKTKEGAIEMAVKTLSLVKE